jgi:hypothetical protein
MARFAGNDFDKSAFVNSRATMHEAKVGGAYRDCQSLNSITREGARKAKTEIWIDERNVLIPSEMRNKCNQPMEDPPA